MPILATVGSATATAALTVGTMAATPLVVELAVPFMGCALWMAADWVGGGGCCMLGGGGATCLDCATAIGAVLVMVVMVAAAGIISVDIAVGDTDGDEEGDESATEVEGGDSEAP